MKNFRTHDLAMQLYKECRTLKIDNPILKDQFERASLSIVLNIAEGSGKIHKKDRRKFFSIAMGSLRETQVLLELMDQQKMLGTADNLGAHIYRLIQNPGGG